MTEIQETKIPLDMIDKTKIDLIEAEMIIIEIDMIEDKIILIEEIKIEIDMIEHQIIEIIERDQIEVQIIEIDTTETQILEKDLIERQVKEINLTGIELIEYKNIYFKKKYIREEMEIEIGIALEIQDKGVDIDKKDFKIEQILVVILMKENLVGINKEEAGIIGKDQFLLKFKFQRKI